MSETTSNETPAPGADPKDYVQDGAVLLGCSRQGRDLVPEAIELRLANRHGLITGATGTEGTSGQSRRTTSTTTPRGSFPTED